MVTWVVPDLLAMGPSLFDPRDLLSIRQAGITAIVNLQEEVRYDYDLSGIKLHHLPIEDFSTPSQETVRRFLDTVQLHADRGEKVYVHCTAGCGRSGTMVAIWLASTKNWDSLDQLVNHLRELRPCAIETDDQMELVRSHLNKSN